MKPIQNGNLCWRRSLAQFNGTWCTFEYADFYNRYSFVEATISFEL